MCLEPRSVGPPLPWSLLITPYASAVRSLIDRLGLPATLLLAVTLLAGATLAMLPSPPKADQQFWTFAQTSADALRQGDPSPLDSFEQVTGRTVAAQVLDRRAMDVRLGTMWSGDPSGLPDVVQLDVVSATRLLGQDRPFVPLDDFISGDVMQRFLQSRLRLWQRDGVMYGLPIDVHPVALAYRVDLWQEVGLDPTQAATWAQFSQLCRDYKAKRAARGEPHMAALEATLTKSDHLTLLLQQAQHDFDGPLDTPAVVDSVMLLADLLADGAAKPTAAGHGRWAADFAAGDVATLWLPDWRSAYLRLSAPQLAGKVALMPLPRWTLDGPPTAGWGATMLAVPAGTPNVDAAIALLTYIAASPEAVGARSAATDIVPPLLELAVEPASDPYYVTGPPRVLFRQLAPHVDLPPHDADFLEGAATLGLALETAASDLASGVTVSDVRRRIAERLAAER